MFVRRIRCPQVCGRDEELSQLHTVVGEARAGRGAMVLISGAAGMGKSRLVVELSHLAEAAGLSTATGRATPAWSSHPFTPLTQALLSLLRGRALPDDEAFLPWRAPLARVLSGLVPSAPSGGLTTTLLGESILLLVERLAPSSGALIVLEDLHWADGDTLAVLEYLSDAVGSARVLLAVTLRDEPGSEAAEFAARLRERRHLVHLQLSALPPDAVVAMARACRPDATADLVERTLRFGDGVPLFVEEIIAAGGLPDSFTTTVRDRLSRLTVDDHEVLSAAAVLGRTVRIEQVAELSGLAPAAVGRALRRAVGLDLLCDDAGELRFRHSLTREAVLATLGLVERHALARAALEGVERSRLPGWQGLGAEIALEAGDRSRAAELLVGAGTDALTGGAVATAIDTLRRAVRLLDGTGDTAARLALLAALSAAGRVDEAIAEGEYLLAAGTAPADAVRVSLAEASARADRWSTAWGYLMATETTAELTDRVAMLRAELALAAGDISGARRGAHAVLASDPVDDDIRCRAHVLLGRVHRLSGLGAARNSFECALATARSARRPVHELDALHELGTIELFDHAGTSRLLEARRSAEQLGALGTRAVIDLQLTAAYLSRFETDQAEGYALAALAMGQPLGLEAVTSKAYCGLAETRVQRRDADDMERLLGLAATQLEHNRSVEAFAWGQCRGILALLEGDWSRALYCFELGVQLLTTAATPEPLEFRALWPLLLASVDDQRAPVALADAQVPALTIAFANRGLLGYAAAILAGRAGRMARADELSLRADAYLARFPVWGELARTCAAPAAASDGWGQPARWLAEATDTFASLGYPALVLRCRTHKAMPTLTITLREGEVLELLREGLRNKEIAVRLHLSPRTVEKHVERLLRKSGARSRTHLVALTARGETT